MVADVAVKAGCDNVRVAIDSTLPARDQMFGGGL